MALDAMRAALPLYAGQAVVFAAGFGLKVGLVAWAFRDEPEAMARFGLLNELLQWTVAVGIFGLAQGLLRLWPERVSDRRDLVATAWTSVVGLSVLVTAAVQLVAPLRRALIGDDVAEGLFHPFGWKAPAIGAVAVMSAALHASGRLRGKAWLEGGERAAVAVLSLAGALWKGLEGLVWGSFVASLLVAVAVRSRGGRFRFALLRDLFSIGHAQLAFTLCETARVVLVLRVMNARGPGAAETGCLAAAVSLVLPFVFVPEVLAQALYPRMVGPAGERRGLDREHRRFLAELAAVWIPLLAVGGAAAWWLLPQVGSGGYAGAVGPALALLPGVAAHGLTAHTGYVVLVRHRLREAALVSGLALALAGVAAWALVPAWGATGAAAALSAALVLRSALLVAVAARPPRAGAPRLTLDAVRAQADAATFPTEVLEGASSAACFFCAAFHGRNDCAHVAAAGVRDVLLVDVDAEKLGEMREIYPPAWRAEAGDAYAVAERLREEGATFDVVVVDAWQSDAPRALAHLPLWLALARRHVVVTVARPWLDEQGLAPEPAALAAWAQRRFGRAVEVESLRYRADWSGGAWWLVVRAPPGPA